MSEDIKFIPYNKNLVSRARELRNKKSQTESEEFFWNAFLKYKRNGYRFNRQKPVGEFILDFYCSKLLLSIELDGEIHKFNIERDKERDNYLKEKFNIKILRFKNEEVRNIIEIKKILLKELKDRKIFIELINRS